MSAKVTEDDWRTILAAAVETIKVEFKKRTKVPGAPPVSELRPVVPLLYTRGAGDAEVCGNARYWERPHADDAQHDLWGWRLLAALKVAIDGARAKLDHPSKKTPISSLGWIYKNVLQKLAISAPFEDPAAFESLDLNVALGLAPAPALPNQNAGRSNHSVHSKRAPLTTMSSAALMPPPPSQPAETRDVRVRREALAACQHVLASAQPEELRSMGSELTPESFRALASGFLDVCGDAAPSHLRACLLDCVQVACGRTGSYKSRGSYKAATPPND